MLKVTKIELELTADPSMFIFFEKGRRGGIFYTSNRYSKAKKKYFKSYDPKQESKKSKDIIFLDANKLYGCAISKFISTNGFQWIDPKRFGLNKCTRNSSKGCFLEVDLEYTEELCKLNNDYPLAPGKIELKKGIAV